MLRQLPLILLVWLFSLSNGALAMENAREKTAIVIAAFGTTYPTAVDSLLSIVNAVETRYPQTPVKMAFTSNIIRKKWHSRLTDSAYRQAHPEVPDSFYQIKNLLGTLADLQDAGYQTIVVQPTLLTHGEEYLDAEAYIKGLLSIETVKERWRPFRKIALGRPLMGTWGAQHPYTEDLVQLATSLATDIEQAKDKGALLVYMGHGNQHLSTGVYDEFADIMNQRYPEVTILVGLVEGHPEFSEVLEQLQSQSARKLLLKPLMVVAGDHANKDMAGPDADSWKSQLTAAGYEVETLMQGLGDNPRVRQLFIDHLQDAAAEAGIELR